MKNLSDQTLEVKEWSEAVAADGYNLQIKALHASPFYVSILEQNWSVKAVLFTAFDKNKIILDVV